jgi:hypothetical protein
LLAERLAQIRADQARDQIDAAAGREGRDDAHGLGGIFSGPCVCGGKRKDGEC